MTAFAPAAPLLVGASSRGLVTFWLLFIFGIVGTLFPHLLAADFLDDPSVVRWLAVPLLIGSSVMLSDYYWHWSVGMLS